MPSCTSWINPTPRKPVSFSMPCDNVFGGSSKLAWWLIIMVSFWTLGLFPFQMAIHGVNQCGLLSTYDPGMILQVGECSNYVCHHVLLNMAYSFSNMGAFLLETTFEIVRNCRVFTLPWDSIVPAIAPSNACACCASNGTSWYLRSPNNDDCAKWKTVGTRPIAFPTLVYVCPLTLKSSPSTQHRTEIHHVVHHSRDHADVLNHQHSDRFPCLS